MFTSIELLMDYCWKIKDWYKLELQTLETSKLFGSTQKLKHKINGEIVPNLEVVETVLVRCNLVNNQYQQKSEILHSFTPYKSYRFFVKYQTK